MQVPPFMQLDSVQSSSLVWQLMPEKPSGHVQVYDATYWMGMGERFKLIVLIDKIKS